jgi:hypothetical protein
MHKKRGPSEGSHVLPARLLSEFGTPLADAHDPGDRRRWKVWTYTPDGEPKSRSVSTCFENGFYSYVDEQGNRNHDHEFRMAEHIEGPFNELLPLFKSNLYVVCNSHSRIIAKYFANLFNRSHQRRSASFSLQRNSLEALKQMVSDQKLLRQLAVAYSLVLGKPVSLSSIRESMLNIYNDQSDEKNQTQFMRNLVRYEDDLADILTGKPYGLLQAPEGIEFVLADTGVITRQVLPNGLVVTGVGFAKSDVHALLPITPQLCIQIGLGNRERYQLRADEVEAINIDSLKLMHRFAYSKTKNVRTEESVKALGGSLRYIKNVFVNQAMTPELLLEFFIFELLGGSDALGFLQGRLKASRQVVTLSASA